MIHIYFIDIYETSVTGYTTYKSQLFNILKNIDNVVFNHVILSYPTDDFFIKKNDSITTFYIPHAGYEIIGWLFRLYIKDSTNTVFFQNYTPSFPVLSVIRRSYKLSKIIFVIHDFIWASQVQGNVDKFKSIINSLPNKYTEYNLLYESYEDNISTFKIVDKIICLSQSTYNLLNEFYKINENRLELIHNGLQKSKLLSKSLLKQKLNINEETKIILFSGRFVRSKGAYALIKSFENVIAEYPCCKLVVAGEFYLNSLTAIKNEIKTKIIFLGELDKKDLIDWYSVADIGVISSYYEQCSYSCIEMMMRGLPIVASNGFGLDSMFSEENAIIAPIGNDENDDEYSLNLANALIQILKSPEIRNKMSLISIQTYKQKYEISYMKQAYKKLIQNL